ncbi:MAG: outer membrane lipoprotein-sorting protein [Treponema sp.]|nr:outer membrane lipoprotein-sorting protein [Treponema sp.]MDY2924166.1 outer membrane lipoprotein-sorting protein [Treponema sp.]
MKLTKILSAAIIVSAVSSVFALDGRTVMQNAYDVKEPYFSHALVQMDLISKDGSVESRKVEEYGRSRDNIKDAVFVFLDPPSVKNTRFLQKENKDRDDDKWIYMPKLRQVTRINSSDGDKSFVGTEFTYDDMSTREVDDDTHELLAETEKKGKFECAKVKSTPKDPADSQYLYRISWVDKETWIPVYIEMYDKKGKLLKVNEITEIEHPTGINNTVYNIPAVSSMKNVQNGRQTNLKLLQLVVDKKIPAGVFTTNFLDTGTIPKQ